MKCECEEPIPRHAGTHPTTCLKCDEVIQE
jgi:hypothetical protein